MVVIVHTGRPNLHVTCQITASNPRKIEIFVSEYTFSRALIKSIFRDFNPTKEHSYEFNGSQFTKLPAEYI